MSGQLGLSGQFGSVCQHARQPHVLLLDLALRDLDDRLAVPVEVPLADVVASRVRPEAHATTARELLAQVAAITGNTRSAAARALSEMLSTFDPSKLAGLVLRHHGRGALLMPVPGAWLAFTWGQQ